MLLHTSIWGNLTKGKKMLFNSVKLIRNSLRTPIGEKWQCPISNSVLINIPSQHPRTQSLDPCFFRWPFTVAAPDTKNYLNLCRRWPKTLPVRALHTCARWWQCRRPAGLSRSLVHNEEQVLGLAELPSEPRKRHTGAAWREAERAGAQVWCGAPTACQWVAGVTLTVVTAEEVVHWAHMGKCDGSWM